MSGWNLTIASVVGVNGALPWASTVARAAAMSVTETAMRNQPTLAWDR